MAQETNDENPQAWLYLYEIKKVLCDFTKSDPRFGNISEAARHLIPVGIEADKEDREKAIKEIS